MPDLITELGWKGEEAACLRLDNCISERHCRVLFADEDEHDWNAGGNKGKWGVIANVML